MQVYTENKLIKMLWRQDYEVPSCGKTVFVFQVRKEWIKFIFNEDPDHISKNSVPLFTSFYRLQMNSIRLQTSHNSTQDFQKDWN